MADSSTDQFLHERLQGVLQADIARSIDTLIKAPADKHDRLCGRIDGLRVATSAIAETVKKWNLERDDE